MKIITINDLKINQTLYDFINKEVLPGTDINQENFPAIVHPRKQRTESRK